MEEQYTMITGALLVPILLLTLREFFAWLGKKNLQASENRSIQMMDNLSSVSQKVEKIEFKLDNVLQMNKTMYDWHDKSDEDGVKIWYVRRSLEEALHENVRAINILAKNSETQTKLLEDMLKQNKEVSKDQAILTKLLERFVDKQ